MDKSQKFDAIIVGGSYAGLSAAMSLGRSLRQVLVIDGGKPCNRYTFYSHNFLTQDGKKPEDISIIAKEEVLKYNSVRFSEDLAVKGEKIENGFKIETLSGKVFTSKKLIFATGLKDIMPSIEGFAACWGKSILHCPYCHGYEVKKEKTVILANGEKAYHYAQLISNWTDRLLLLTNGKSVLSEDQSAKIKHNNIEIIEKEIDSIAHDNGKVKAIYFKDGSVVDTKVIYSAPAFEQHSNIPEKIGCELNEYGLIKVDNFMQTTVNGVYACGDNSHNRAVSLAVSTGNMAGAFLNFALIEESF